MRFKRPKHRDKRIIKKFLWFPVTTMAGETRWLEYATIEQIYHGRSGQYKGWRTTGFKDKEA